jgi:metallo-beta-lactamase class B
MRFPGHFLLLGLAAAPAAGHLSAQVVTTAATQATRTGMIHLASDVAVRRLSPRIWLHRTLGVYHGDTVPTNGLIVVNDTAAVLIDTGWNPEQAGRLLRWAEDSLHRPVRLAVITHSHGDRAGGLAALRRAQIRTVALPATVARIAVNRRTGLTPLSDLQSRPETLEGIELYYPGPGHTVDNIVVFVSDDRVLFGGCLVKDQVADDLGNLRDADLTRWPLTIGAVLSRYGTASVVVPGHGDPGDLDLLRHTQALLEGEERRTGGN